MVLKAISEHPLRVAFRGAWLAFEFFWAAVSFLLIVKLRRKRSFYDARCIWFRQSARRIMRVFHVDLQVSGVVPTHGLLVSNHLSYIDILTLGTAAAPIFVAKQEVRNWPVLGWFAYISGTVFVRRERRTDVSRSADTIQDALEDGGLVVLFPEGTSSGGETILPFKSSLLEPAVQGDHPISAVFLQYSLNDGIVADDVCYWRDMTLLPHLINLLSKRNISASLSFTPVENGGKDRKLLAQRLHAEVTRLKEAAYVGQIPRPAQLQAH